MGLFRLDEVFQLAMKAEETGQRLYEAVAAEAKDGQVADLCRKLAGAEGKHFLKFQAMKQALPTNIEARKLSLDDLDFVQSLVKGRVVPDEVEALRIARSHSLPEVLDIAIQAERDSQAFYGQILDGIEAKDAAAIREIIAEERHHEEMLVEARRKAGT